MNRILIRSPNWIGDQILAYPFYQLLRKYYPKAWITVVCPEWVKDIQFKGFVDEVLVIPRKKDANVLQSFQMVYQFSKQTRNKGPWDLGITIPNSFGTAMLLYFSGVIQRRGYDTDARGIFLNQKIKWNANPGIHRSQAYLSLLKPEGVPYEDIRNFWEWNSEKEFDAAKHWPDIEPLPSPVKDYFIIAPGATADSRRWSIAQFSQLVGLIQKKYAFKAVIVGGNAEREIAIQLMRQGHEIEDYTGRGWVSAHWKLFKQAKFTVCNESGLAHVASICGSAVQIVCGAADPRRTKPLGPGKIQVSINPVECWPCERNFCKWEDDQKNKCLNGIFAEKVLEEIERGFLNR